MEQMKELIFSIFDSVSAQAMKQGYSVMIRYEKGQNHSKTIISESNRDEDALTLSAYPIKDEEGEAMLYADGVPVAEFNDADEEEEDDDRDM